MYVSYLNIVSLQVVYLSEKFSHLLGYLEWFQQLRLLHGRIRGSTTLVNSLSPQMSELVEDAVASWCSDIVGHFWLIKNELQKLIKLKFEFLELYNNDIYIYICISITYIYNDTSRIWYHKQMFAYTHQKNSFLVQLFNNNALMCQQVFHGPINKAAMYIKLLTEQCVCIYSSKKSCFDYLIAQSQK